MVCARVGRCPRSGAAPEAAARGRGRSTLPHESWNDPPLPPPPSLPYSLDTSRPSFGTNRTRPEEQERHRHRQVLPGADAPGTPSPPSPRRTPRIGARGPLLTAAVAARRRGVCNLFSAEQGPLTRGAAGQAFSRHVVKHRNKLLRRPAGHRGGLMVSSEEQDRPMARLLSPRLWCVRRHYGRDPECEASPWRSAADWLRARAWWHTWSQHGVSAVCPQVLAPGGHADRARAGKRDDYGQRPFAARGAAASSRTCSVGRRAAGGRRRPAGPAARRERRAACGCCARCVATCRVCRAPSSGAARVARRACGSRRVPLAACRVQRAACPICTG